MGAFIKKILVGVFLVIICLPLLKQLSGFILPTKPLKGFFVAATDYPLTIRNWFNGDFQTRKDNYIKDNFEFHNFLVRCNNEIEFQIFGKINASDVVVGKEDYLYEAAYINSYYGRNFIGNDSLQYRLNLLKALQDTMRKQNKLFVLVLASGKATFFPEYIPDKLKTEPKPSNYTQVKKLGTETGLNIIDFNSYFLSQKNKSKYPLYPKYGIHWSKYGSYLAYDSMTRYIEKKMNINLPDLTQTGIEESDTARYSDADLLEGMNLLTDKKGFKMAYPQMQVNYDPYFHKKPSLIVIADSYWWEISSSNLPSQMFDKYQFWYYSKEIYGLPIALAVDNANYYKRIGDADVILILQTEASLKRFGFHFEELVKNVLFKNDAHSKAIQRMREEIYLNSDWLAKVKEKAEERAIPLDSMVHLDAEFMYQQNNKK